MAEWKVTGVGSWSYQLRLSLRCTLYVPGDDGRVFDRSVEEGIEWTPAVGRANFLIVETDGTFVLMSPCETRPAFFNWTVRRVSGGIYVDWRMKLSEARLRLAAQPEPPRLSETTHNTLDDAIAEYRRFMAEHFPQPIRFRPSWTESVSGCVMIQLWAGTGEIDHTFAELETMLHEMDRAGVPANTLVYFWGWFAPFDRMYPEYWPAKELGGEPGLTRVLEAAARYGYKLMPHLNHHGFSRDAPRFAEFAAAQARNADGEPQGWREGGEPSIEYMRPCHQPWREYHCEKLARFVEAFPVDAIFWDQYGSLIDDPVCDYFSELHRFADAAQAAVPQTVLTSEILSERIYDLPLWMQWGTPWCGLPVREDMPHSDLLGRLFSPILAGTFGHQGSPAAVPVPHTWPSYYWYIERWGREEAVRRAHGWHRSVGAVPTIRVNFREYGLDATARRVLRGGEP